MRRVRGQWGAGRRDNVKRHPSRMSETKVSKSDTPRQRRTGVVRRIENATRDTAAALFGLGDLVGIGSYDIWCMMI